MQLPAMAAWAWIPIVICAALAQTLRNAAQRTLTADVGTLPATLVRFLYGLPFAVGQIGGTNRGQIPILLRVGSTLAHSSNKKPTGSQPTKKGQHRGFPLLQ